MTRIPKNYKGAVDDNAPRMSDYEVASMIHHIVNPKSSLHTPLSWRSEVLSDGLIEYIQITARGHHFGFYVKDGKLTNCFHYLDPSSRQYSIVKDAGSVVTLVPREEWQALESLIVPSQDHEPASVGVVPCYMVVTNFGKSNQMPVHPMRHDKGPGGRGLTYPTGLIDPVFMDQTQANKLADSFRDYANDVKSKENKKRK